MSIDPPPDSKPPRRKRGRLPSVDETFDECDRSPVEHLIYEVSRVKERVAAVEGVAVDHAATLAERHEMPTSEAWQRMATRIDALHARLQVCEEERAVRSRWARWIRGILAALGTGAVSALAWVVVRIGDAGEDRAVSRQRDEQLRRAVEAVEALKLQQAVDHARLEDLRRGP